MRAAEKHCVTTATGVKRELVARPPLTSHILARQARWVCGRFAGSHNRSDAHDKVLIESSQWEIVVKGTEFAHGNPGLTKASMETN